MIIYIVKWDTPARTLQKDTDISSGLLVETKQEQEKYDEKVYGSDCDTECIVCNTDGLSASATAYARIDGHGYASK